MATGVARGAAWWAVTHGSFTSCTAQLHGSRYKWFTVGVFVDACCYAFYQQVESVIKGKPLAVNGRLEGAARY